MGRGETHFLCRPVGMVVGTKNKRIESTGRETDVSDAVALLRKIVEDMKEDQYQGREQRVGIRLFTPPIEDQAIDRVAKEYEKKDQSQGFM
jgi:hypothetical protein